MPWGWGVAWYEPWRDSAVILPVPLNWLAGALYWAWSALAVPSWARHLARVERELCPCCGRGPSEGF